jgi:small subunit ribosomal protein S1
LKELRKLVGVKLSLTIIGVQPKEGKLIFSEKGKDSKEDRKDIALKYSVGDELECEVTGVVDFGIFLKLEEGLEGLVHISEIDWSLVEDPRALYKLGDKVRAKIIEIKEGKVSLSIKALIEDPWKTVRDHYKEGDKVNGKIIKIEPFGLMVSLDKDIHGLAHISELSDEPIGNINDKFKVGQEMEFEIMSLEPAEHRLGLKVAGVKGKSGRRRPAGAKEGEVKPE